MLENLTPAERVVTPPNFRPAFEFDGETGVATLPPVSGVEVPSFDEFLIEQGFDPSEYEVIGNPRTSRWQKYDGDWLTSYRFNFRKRNGLGADLPLLLQEARKKVKVKPLTNAQDKALVVLWSDLQVGKVDYRGNSQSLIERIELMKIRLEALIKREKPNQVLFIDLGDTVEGFNNAADMVQLQSNDLSIMEQVDLATTFAYDVLKAIYRLVPDITYASVGSNHCQWRIGKQAVGKPTDDWGVFIGRQLARLSKEANLNIRFIEPQAQDDTLAIDVFKDQFHILGVMHGHQAGNRPEQVPDWWRKQSFGRQPVADATTLVHGHWHHLRIQELGSNHRGTSRFLIQAPTLDNGSNWYRRGSGEDSVPGLAVFALERGADYTGTVWKL
jgi:hypothetical protein